MNCSRCAICAEHACPLCLRNFAIGAFVSRAARFRMAAIINRVTVDGAAPWWLFSEGTGAGE